MTLEMLLNMAVVGAAHVLRDLRNELLLRDTLLNIAETRDRTVAPVLDRVALGGAFPPHLQDLANIATGVRVRHGWAEDVAVDDNAAWRQQLLQLDVAGPVVPDNPLLGAVLVGPGGDLAGAHDLAIPLVVAVLVLDGKGGGRGKKERNKGKLARHRCLDDSLR